MSLEGAIAANGNTRGWSIIALRSLLSQSKDDNRPNLPLLGVNLHSGVTQRSANDGRPAASEDLTAYKVVTPGDIIMNRLGKPHGSVGMSPWDGITSPAYWVMGINPQLGEPRFFHHLLRSRHLVAEYERLGKNQPPNQFDISWDAFRAIEIPLPLLEEQCRIADFLDAETARIDRLTKATEQQQHIVLERQSMAFVASVHRAGGPALDSLDPISHSGDWPILPLNQALRQLTNGYVGPTRDLFVDEGTPYLQSLHIKNGGIDFARRPYFVRPEWASERPRIRLGSEDILIVQTGAIGEVGIVNETFAGASCHALLIARTHRHLLNPRYLWHTFRSHWGRHALLREQTGALHPHLEAGNVRFMKIPVPSLAKQEQVIAQTEEISRDATAISEALLTRRDLLAERRQALITAAVTGQFDVSAASGRNVTDGVQ
ncbi:restriction endonuclease subunit S [Streptomyces sp. NPDC058067]|uniref:restriction endonuclease subunit S n=1 Tax=Streptomyces sp. NPDC058067 TaxID=3346324 RepID=UPI0036E54724